jgi:hypothetical protein
MKVEFNSINYDRVPGIVTALGLEKEGLLDNDSTGLLLERGRRLVFLCLRLPIGYQEQH